MRPLASLLTVTLLIASPVLAIAADTPSSQAKTYSESEKAGIEAIIHNYIVDEHPEILVEAIQKMQSKKQAEGEAKTVAAIKDNKDKIFNDPETPMSGNPKGDVTVVEFFDYNCGYCKMSEEATEKLLIDDKNVKFIYKDFPILGPVSVEAAKASLASINQKKYVKFHDALMGHKDHLSEDIIYQVAKTVGLDVDKLKKDMASDKIKKQVDDNVALGAAIGVHGTPMFIINDKIYPGAFQGPDMLEKAVNEVRSASTAKP